MNIRKQLELYYWVKTWLEFEDMHDTMNQTEWTFQISKITRKIRQICNYITDEQAREQTAVEPPAVEVQPSTYKTMQEKGKVVFVGQKRTGLNTRTGNEWSCQDFVIETNERFPRKIAFTIMGAESIAKADLQLGQYIDVIGYSESHEYNGQWYTENRCTDILVNGMSIINRMAL